MKGVDSGIHLPSTENPLLRLASVRRDNMKCSVTVKYLWQRGSLFTRTLLGAHLTFVKTHLGMEAQFSEANLFLDIKIFLLHWANVCFLQLPHCELHAVWCNKGKPNPHVFTRRSKSSWQLSLMKIINRVIICMIWIVLHKNFYWEIFFWHRKVLFHI